MPSNSRPSFLPLLRCQALLLAVYAALLIMPLAGGAAAQRNRDPLNNAEVDELRETNEEPEKRLKLIMKFAQARLASIDEVLADTKTAAADKPDKIHDLLQDFLSIYDELGDNLDMYIGRKGDLRKPLRDLVQGDSELRARLRRLKQTAKDPAAEKQYGFVLDNAIDAVNSGADEHRQMLAEQQAASHKK
jgi:hypothetical protein